MADYQQKDNTGSLFKNDKGSNDKRPDYTGRGMVNGQLVRISAWLKESKAGEKYLSLSFDEHKAKQEATAPAMDDDVPF